MRTAVAVLVAAWLAFATALFIVPHDEDPPRDADAVVALAGGLERLPAARRLVGEGVAPVVAISYSDELEDTQRSEICEQPDAARVGLRCFRPDPFSTRGEARATARLARQRGWDEVVVVTSGYHVVRTRILFERCLDASVSVVGTDAEWWQDALALATETAKLVLAAVRRGC